MWRILELQAKRRSTTRISELLSTFALICASIYVLICACPRVTTLLIVTLRSAALQNSAEIFSKILCWHTIFSTMKCLEFSWIPYAALYLQSSRRSCYSSTWAIGWHWHSSRAFHFPPFSSLFFCRRMMQVAPSQGYGYGSYGYTKGNGLNGIDFLSGDFDIGIDGDLLTAGIAAAAAAFFFLTYGAITAGKKRKKRSVEDDNQIQSGFWPNWIMGKLKIEIYVFKILVLWVFCVSTQARIDERKIPL